MLTAADTIATPAPKRNSAGKNGKKKATKKQKVAHAKAAASKEEGKDTSELPLSLTLDETENPFALIERDAVLYKKVTSYYVETG